MDILPIVPIKDLLAKYNAVRKQTETLCLPLKVEDYIIQSMPDVSPIKWHLAHTSWFFETFILAPYSNHYAIFNSSYPYLFNSYYESLGAFHPREQRGFLSRPTVEEIYQYRHYVDEQLEQLASSSHNLKGAALAEVSKRLELGIHHEQQHQELMLMDIKFNFAHNPLRPKYLENTLLPKNDSLSPPKNISSFSQHSIFNQDYSWFPFAEGLYQIGWDGTEFAFDNEQPKHSVYLNSYEIGNRLITNGEFLEFMLAGGYQKPLYWLSEGWQMVLKHRWQAPLYWEKINHDWYYMTLQGLLPLELNVPVCHISYYEADAYARWAHARLPTEAEWEIAASQYHQHDGNFLEMGHLHPLPATHSQSSQFLGDLWEWTQSPYLFFPGFKPFNPPFDEYNSKFACNQYVLRGGCAITPQEHIRLTYRNFYYPHQRWPFTGIRLARNL